MQAIFNCAGGDPDMLHEQYKNLVSREFFEGDIGTADDGPITIFLEKGLSSPITVVHLCTPNRVTYRRTRRHIQKNQVDCYVIWLIRRGGIKLTRSSGSVHASEGKILIYDSATPFFAEIACDSRGLHDSLQAVIPAHMFREHIAGKSECNLVMETAHGTGRIAAHMLDLLADNGHVIGRKLGDKMAGALLEALASCAGEEETDNARKSIFDRRLEEIEQYVARNLTSRDLSANSIAEACNISPRYLCYILKAAGYTFSQLVWDKRLEKAKEWLVSARMQSYLVHEIASMTGYKSAAHFSRAFKSACGCTPSEYRQQMTATAAEGRPAMLEAAE